MRDDAHLHAEAVHSNRPVSADIPWIIAFVAVFAFNTLALAGWFR